MHGNVLGGGLSLAVHCDLRVAASGTTFAFPEVALGLPLTWGTVPRLINEIGASRARELTLLCRKFDTATARDYGVVHSVVDPADLDDEILRTVEEIMDKPALSVDMTKSQFRAYGTREGNAAYAEADLFNLALRDPGCRLSPRGPN